MLRVSDGEPKYTGLLGGCQRTRGGQKGGGRIEGTISSGVKRGSCISNFHKGGKIRSRKIPRRGHKKEGGGWGPAGEEVTKKAFNLARKDRPRGGKKIKRT